MRFVLGKTYVWMLPVWAVAFFGAIELSQWQWGSPGGGFVVLPLFMIWLVGSELRSGVALDKYWCGAYPRGSVQFAAMITGQIVAALLATVAFIFLATK